MQILASMICRRNCKQEAAIQPKPAPQTVTPVAELAKEVQVFLSNPFYLQSFAPLNQAE